jgi:hypothetical protein
LVVGLSPFAIFGFRFNSPQLGFVEGLSTLSRVWCMLISPQLDFETYNQPYLRMINLQPALARGNKAYKNPVRRVKPTINPI